MAENIVETILVRLGLDSKEYNSEADKATKKNKKLTDSVEETDKTVGAVTKTLAKWFGAMAAATGVLKLVDEVQRLNDELYHLEKNLGMSAETIRNWQGAGAAMGGSAQGMTSTIKSLNGQMNDFVIMGDTSLLPFMNALGVSMVDAQGKLRDTDQVMLDLADSFSKMDREQALSISSKMGIDEGTFNTLVQGRKEMEKMLDYQSKIYKSSEEELKVSRELAKNRALLGTHWESLKMMLANAIIPIFVKLSEVALGIFEYIQENQRPIQAFFKGLTFVIGAMLIPILAKATVAALAFIAPFAPFILVVGALGAAFGLLYDDYKAWAEGGKSLFDWGAFRKYIDESTISTNNLRTAFSNLVKDMMNNTIPTLRGYAEIIQKLSSGDLRGAAIQASSMMANLSNRATDFIDNATGQAEGTLRGQLDNAAKNTVDWFKNRFNGGSQSSGKANQKYSSKAFTPEKAATIAKVARNIGVDPNDLAAVISFETGGTFNPNTRNPYSSATGLIQFMQDKKGKYYGMSRNEFGALSFDKQMEYVERYYKERDKRFRAGNESTNAVGDVYGAVTGWGYKRGSEAYELNKVWDSNRNGIIEKGEMVQNPKFQAHQRQYYDNTLNNGANVQQSMRGTDFIDLRKAQANQPIANRANETQVTVGDININTSSSTVTGNVQDAMNAVKQSVYPLTPSYK